MKLKHSSASDAQPSPINHVHFADTLWTRFPSTLYTLSQRPTRLAMTLASDICASRRTTPGSILVNFDQVEQLIALSPNHRPSVITIDYDLGLRPANDISAPHRTLSLSPNPLTCCVHSQRSVIGRRVSNTRGTQPQCCSIYPGFSL